MSLMISLKNLKVSRSVLTRLEKIFRILKQCKVSRIMIMMIHWVMRKNLKIWKRNFKMMLWGWDLTAVTMIGCLHSVGSSKTQRTERFYLWIRWGLLNPTKIFIRREIVTSSNQIQAMAYIQIPPKICYHTKQTPLMFSILTGKMIY